MSAGTRVGTRTVAVRTDPATREPIYFKLSRGLATWTYRRDDAHVFPSRAEAQRTVFGEPVRYEDAEVAP